MATRATYTSASPKFSGKDYADDMAAKADLWFNNMTLIPTLITNTANDYTITIDPPLKSGTDVVAGMGFYITPSADNSGTVRLRVTDTGSWFNVTKSNGSNLAAGDWKSDTVYHVLFVGGSFRILNATAASSGGNISGLVNEQIFNTSGTWTKPAEISTNALVEVYLWGGGGGGNGGAGGGGGACVTKTFKITELPATVAVTIGAGGAAGAQGGVSTFGTLLSAFGGGGGAANGYGGGSGGSSGGGGGGLTSAGSSATGISGYAANRGGDGGFGGGGGGSVVASGGWTNPETGTVSKFQTTVVGAGYSGGAGGSGVVPLNNGSNAVVTPITAAGSAIQGGGGGSSSHCQAGASVFGGGGGGSSGKAGGASVYGGAGGANGVIGSTPAGGGGSGAAGGIGRCQVRIIL